MQNFQDWKAFMLQTKSEMFYLDFVEQIYQEKEVKSLTQEKWKREDNTQVLSSRPQ